MNQPWSLVFTFFRSLSLAHLERSLFSLSKQTVKPDEFIIYCNDVDFSQVDVLEKIGAAYNKASYYFPDTRFEWDCHNDPAKRNASYAQNKSIRMAKHDTFIFTKADCIYTEDFCEKLLAQKTDNPMEFIAPHMLQMNYWSEQGKPHEQVDHAKDLEGLNWREDVRRLNQNTGQLHNHATIDAPSFCTTKQAVDRAGWYDEHIKNWGYWQIDLQGNMARRGVEMKVVPEILVFHMQHGLAPEDGERNLQQAHAEWLASPRRNDPEFQ